MFLVAFLGSVVGSLIGIALVEVLVRIVLDLIAPALGQRPVTPQQRTGWLDTIESPSRAMALSGPPPLLPGDRGSAAPVMPRTSFGTHGPNLRIEGRDQRTVNVVLPEHGAALTIGSGRSDDVRLVGWLGVVPGHVSLQRSGDSWLVALETREGVAHLAGRPLGHAPQALEPGVEVGFGTACLRLQGVGPRTESLQGG